MALKQKTGFVVSNRMQKTIVIKVENRFPHAIYSKTIVKTKKYFAHDELNQCNIGDLVLIKESLSLIHI